MPGVAAAGRFGSLAALDSPVTIVRFVDEAKAEALARLGVLTVGDLLGHYPFRYLDLSTTTTLGAVTPGTEATVVGTVHEVKVKRPRPRLTIVEVALVDGTGVLLGVWFNQAYMAQRFRAGERVAFAGRVQLDFGLKQIRNPFVEKLGADDDPAAVARIVPIHRATESLSTNWIRRLVAEALEAYGDLPDHLPAALRISRDLIPLADALRQVHFPASAHRAEQARRRLAYDELLALQIGMATRRHALVDERSGVAHVTDGPALAAMRAALPFRPTKDQDRAAREVLHDMHARKPMNRMLLGDVGSGKTLVAALALAAAVDTGSQAAMMAPTEVLARQYARAAGPLLDSAGVRWELLTGSTSAADRRRIVAATSDGSVSVLFGTHALLEESVAFDDLSLAVVDEQHRFGVNQRLGLRGKGHAVDLLVMTATPIPRSLALTLYGDLDASYLRERPGGRDLADHVTTRIVPPTGREAAYARVREEAAAGRQAYVVCALVDESDVAEAKAAVKEAERLRKQVFPQLRVGLLTGRMRPAEKAEAMDSFCAGDLDVLVATTVIEVGVDVPNATVMIVEDAERFGLAQLHQLRGRIGRGENPGEFLLFADPRSEEGRRRMDAVATTSDGFELAERDLSLRGQGQLLGERQHGLPELRLARLGEDADLLAAAREDAIALVRSDPRLDRPEHVPLMLQVRARFGEAWEWVSSG